MIAVSSCLLGEDCRYSGNNNYDRRITELLEDEEVISICPEVLGGLSTPRPPAEIQGGDGKGVLEGIARVIDKEGNDVTVSFIEGARESLALIKEHGCSLAILKAKSPSCGSRVIYDGSFSGNKKAGVGVTTALLQKEGIEVFNEEEIDRIITKL
ncbi:uncharacterized protein YbbK (DUF523 family) [Orenia metallireducens]|uniref:Uncharacterized conserved protein YbbK, DUF523 family n=1 Tax=Orenia metallireducens TaxID=1413210 RepID=A0A285FXC6_9FIRM|nr:DUF523 domain-containing protein [Orenia metallireducens]PRX35571.1 uncharacterized protein YbbK (DUF523 family) [Orenia metallireducens]SNY15982.1 Uncharacterized conserved protein YbbK, DUF523 family [Orenia metallireducens]